MADGSSDLSAFLKGEYSGEDSQSAYLLASQSTDTNLSAFLAADVLVNDSAPGFLSGGGDLTTSTAKAFTQGILRDSLSVYLEGAMFTVNGTEIVIIGGVLYG